ncbi:MAG: glycosyltransferase family 4 protein [Acidobacteriota bacterium]
MSTAGPRVGLVPSEPLRASMAGIGIRYLEMARRLPAAGLEVVLVTAGDPADVPDVGLPATQVRQFERGRLGEILGDCDVVVSQGQLANDVVLELSTTPVVIDLYDPFLVENLTYVESLGLDPWRNDHATWVLQMSHGDFFLCSCQEQRQFYLGFLTALGRVNPRRLHDDPDLRGLVDVVPFGVPDALPPYAPYLDRPSRPVRRLLFGGLYDWYDPWPVLEAVERRPSEPWQLIFVRNPNPETPQRLMHEVEVWARRHGLWGDRVLAIGWVPSERRWDLLRDADVVVATHRPTLETDLSLRTRFLDALAARRPVVTTDGGGMSRLLRRHDAGWVVPPDDADAVGTALEAALDPARLEPKLRGAEALLDAFAWDRALAPLVAFCRAPCLDATKREFAFRPTTHAPPDRLSLRLRRRLRGWWRRRSEAAAS